MAFEITAFATNRVKARALHAGSSNWVILTVIEIRRGHREQTEITLFFDGPNAAAKATTYAEAINSADRVLHADEVARELAEEEAEAAWWLTECAATAVVKRKRLRLSSPSRGFQTSG